MTRTLELVPVTLLEARTFVNEHHRHNEAPIGWAFGVGLSRDGVLVGVAMAGRPAARKTQQADRAVVEILRVCVLEEKNANSRLYGAICRAAGALGYRSAITYTLEHESGASLRAAGFVAEETLPPARSWWQPTRPRQEETLFGPRKRPTGERKIRWRRALRG